jgi:5-formyltetrahydrofolate cyclo-ligase
MPPGAATVIAVVFDDEILDQVPAEPHDVLVDGALTPSGLDMFGR